MIKTGHFFSGGGGGILAAEVLGHESVFALEIDERRCRIIRESGWFPGIHVECSDIRQFDPEPWKGRMDCIAAGFPCQDISSAGPGHGINGKRSGLIWQLFQAIDVIQPPIIFLENSPRIRTKGRREIIKALVERGYSWRDGTLAASHVGAGHKRNRWWCLAANDNGLWKLEQERRIAEQRGWIGNSFTENADFTMQRWRSRRPECARQQRQMFAIRRGCETTDSYQCGRNRRAWKIEETQGWLEFADSIERAFKLGGLSDLDAEAIAVAGAYTKTINWSSPDAGACRVVDGLADRVDRIKTCGDGQVPLQAAVAWALLAWG
jgi:DNA (cytosine-5)-methyltransferase 1